jgi:hypothetical protein
MLKASRFIKLWLAELIDMFIINHLNLSKLAGSHFFNVTLHLERWPDSSFEPDSEPDSESDAKLTRWRQSLAY